MKTKEMQKEIRRIREERKKLRESSNDMEIKM